MLIDWFTVGAQVLNFIILVWLLKRFLYRPILKAIDAREQRIAAELADAAAKQEEAGRERDAFRQKNEAFDRQRAASLKAVAEEAADERRRLLDEARAAADALTARRQEALAGEARALDQSLNRWAQDEVFAIARKTLTDLAGSGLEECMVALFLQRLERMTDAEKTGLSAALATDGGSVLVRSAFDLPAGRQAAIRAAVDAAVSRDVDLRFQTAPALIGGIELVTDGQKVAWSIAEYLATMETGLADLLARQSGGHSAAPPAPVPPPPAAEGR